MRFSYNVTMIVIGSVLLFLLGSVLYMLFLVRNSYFATHLPVVYAGVALLLILLVALVRRVVIAFWKGEEGEERVGRLLNKLPSAYYSLHDFSQEKKGNIDFVVVGPTGVWTIEVKNTRGGVITFKDGLLCRNGYPLEGHDLKQAYAEAQELQTYLRESLELFLPVHPVLVFSNRRAKMKFGFHGINGVQVVGIQWLIKLLQEANTDDRLTPEQCQAVRDVVRKHTSTV